MVTALAGSGSYGGDGFAPMETCMYCACLARCSFKLHWPDWSEWKGPLAALLATAGAHTMQRVTSTPKHWPTRAWTVGIGGASDPFALVTSLEISCEAQTVDRGLENRAKTGRKCADTRCRRSIRTRSSDLEETKWKLVFSFNQKLCLELLVVFFFGNFGKDSLEREQARLRVIDSIFPVHNGKLTHCQTDATSPRCDLTAD